MRIASSVLGCAVTCLWSCVAPPAPISSGVESQSAPDTCTIMSDPGDFAGSRIEFDVVIVPNYFDGPTVRSVGCPAALRLGRLPQTSNCEALEEALGLPGYEPEGDVIATLMGRIELSPGQLPTFLVSECSNVRVGPQPASTWSW